ncbi:MAG: hypothetical protein ACI8PZ_005184 [Myxococcota bacterium]|jgi:hypothetical protein
MVRLLALLLVACSASAVEATTEPRADAPALGSEAYTDAVRADVHGATEGIHQLAAHTRTWDAATRAAVRDAARELATQCPYNRATMQLPQVLDGVLARTAGAIPAIHREHAGVLAAGVSAHVALLTAIGAADLPTPLHSDYLSKLPPAALVSGASLRADPDPIGRTRALLDVLPGLVEGYDPITVDRIDAATATMAAATRDQWPMKLHMLTWRDGIQDLALVAETEAARAELKAADDLLDTLLQQRC